MEDAGHAYTRQLGLVFEVPSDLRAVYQQFGISLPAWNGDDSWTLPMPARIVVSADGTIHNVEADPDYTHRPEPEETVALLEGLS